jgi:hypothetical protein
MGIGLRLVGIGDTLLYPLVAVAAWCCCTGGGGLSVGVQSFLTGGGSGVDMVVVVTSDMICTASFMAWYMRNISSRRVDSSSDSCIRLFGLSEE